MAEAGGQERTESATPRKRAQAREEGRVVKSREVVSTVLFLGNLLFFSAAGVALVQQMQTFMYMDFLNLNTTEVSPAGMVLLGTRYLQRLAVMVLPLLGLMFTLGLLSNLLQTGFLISWKAAAPKWSHVNPAEGLQRLFSSQALGELGKGILKLGLVGVVLFAVIRAQVEQFVGLSIQPLEFIMQYMGHSTMTICIRALYVMVVIAIVDYAWQRWQYEKSLRMSPQEIKEELRQEEGDPQRKAHIRGLMREMAMKRMMQDVPKADVVITNPTHLAIALRYRRDEMPAPQVVAKGAGHVAERIKTIAQEHRIPLVENKPVAQSLYKSVDIGGLIPEALYKAVAEILAYVYRFR